jgi:uncharacterized protein
MGLIRFLFFLLVAGVVWFMVKNYQRKQELRGRKDDRGNNGRLQGGKIVRCKACDVHLPEQDALRDGDNWFCGQAHLQAWRASHDRK